MYFEKVAGCQSPVAGWSRVSVTFALRKNSQDDENMLSHVRGYTGSRQPVTGNGTQSSFAIVLIYRSGTSPLIAVW
jgi:hypothetical protein